MAISRSLDKCFKCQQLGHWAKDCPSKSTQEQFPQFSLGYDVIPPKMCRCVRQCLILISKSSANPGRKYYRCFQCNFFDWCEDLEASASQNPNPNSQYRDPNPNFHSRNPGPSLSTPSWNGQNRSLCSSSRNSQNPSPVSPSNNTSLSNPSDNTNNSPIASPISPTLSSYTSAHEELGLEQQFQYLSITCQCGAGPCRVFTAQTEKNKGRQFFSCPIRKCNFFKWCEDLKASVSENPNPNSQSQFPDFTSHSRNPNPSLSSASCNSPNFSPISPSNNSSLSNPSNNPNHSPISPTQESNTSAHEELGSEKQFEPLSIRCECEAGPCRVKTAKTEKNKGRRFYTCHIKKGEGSCGFFKWCDQLDSAAYSARPEPEESVRSNIA